MLEADEQMAQPWEGTGGTMLLFPDSKESLAATVRAFGKGTKEDGGDTIDFIPDFPLQIKVHAFKNRCCEAVQKKRIVPAVVVPAKPAQEATLEVVIPEHEETVVEYLCTPFLEAK